MSPYPAHDASLAACTATVMLRPYQKEVLQQMKALYAQGTHRILVPMATGMGKTTVFSHVPSAFPELAKRGTLVLVHREELVRQAQAQLTRCGLKVGIEMRGERSSASDDAVVASVQTLGYRRGAGGMARLRQLVERPPGIVIVDEAHHMTEPGLYNRILNGETNSQAVRAVLTPEAFELGMGSKCGGKTRGGALVAGFTATPDRADGKALTPFFDAVCAPLDLAWGILGGHLVNIIVDTDTLACLRRRGQTTLRCSGPAFLFLPFPSHTDIKVRGSTVGGRDFDSAELSAAVNTSARNEAIVRALKHMPQRLPPSTGVHHLTLGGSDGGGGDSGGGSTAEQAMAQLERPTCTLCFCASVEHAHDLARVLSDAGMPAAAVDGTTPLEERRAIIERFRAGDLAVVTNFGVFTEVHITNVQQGFDAPHVNTVVMARPTMSQPLFMQMIGRGTRPAPGVLDSLYSAEGPMSAELRRSAIDKSHKPWMRLVDVVDNCGKHKVKTAGSVLGLHPLFFGRKDGDSTPTSMANVLEQLAQMKAKANLTDVMDFAELQVRIKRSWLVPATTDTTSTISGMLSLKDLKIGTRVKGVKVQIVSVGTDKAIKDPRLSWRDVRLEMSGGAGLIVEGDLTWSWRAHQAKDVNDDQLYCGAWYTLAARVKKVIAETRTVWVHHCRLELCDDER
ncbi:P-loop containing nucleoside triphosphate hydrolase protein [Tribonema minus]|uniref:P-loop containing nucleoside triphosphate hydrolase protein n=1 Tax=Tribonema minus TaxID=303371 RepID=A0A835YHM4_9STRA|nr:P-loop containing nucleoside triphosphate hydrolase protein [Tribonema minus]